MKDNDDNDREEEDYNYDDIHIPKVRHAARLVCRLHFNVVCTY